MSYDKSYDSSMNPSTEPLRQFQPSLQQSILELIIKAFKFLVIKGQDLFVWNNYTIKIFKKKRNNNKMENNSDLFKIVRLKNNCKI